jgi:hypothetical protein
MDFGWKPAEKELIGRRRPVGTLSKQGEAWEFPNWDTDWDLSSRKGLV